MKFDIITLFPEQMNAIVNESILKRAQAAGKIEIAIHDLRKWTTDERKTVDDRPFGGGPGMLMMVEPIYKALKELGVYPRQSNHSGTTVAQRGTIVVLTSAGGETWTQGLAQEYSEKIDRLVIICGHYEGVDQRVVEHLVDAEISIGNYVLTGGELPAGIIVDSIARLVPGVLGNAESLKEESHSSLRESELKSSKSNQLEHSSTRQLANYKEYPQYTRPATFTTDEGEEWKAPDVLLSGNHAEIEKWKRAN
jgi:tRNA (guanine37-N1)-methyltransferase